MKIKEDDIPEFIRDLRDLIGKIKGFQELTETISLSYVVVVDSKENKEAVVQVGNILTEQAAKNCGIDLELVPATSDEIAEATNRYAAMMQSKVPESEKSKKRKKKGVE